MCSTCPGGLWRQGLGGPGSSQMLSLLCFPLRATHPSGRLRFGASCPGLSPAEPLGLYAVNRISSTVKATGLGISFSPSTHHRTPGLWAPQMSGSVPQSGCLSRREGVCPAERASVCPSREGVCLSRREGVCGSSALQRRLSQLSRQTWSPGFRVLTCVLLLLWEEALPPPLGVLRCTEGGSTLCHPQGSAGPALGGIDTSGCCASPLVLTGERF